MKYRIESVKGFWLPKANGYTIDRNQAGIFEFDDLKNMNLDQCKLHLLQLWELQELENGAPVSNVVE